LQILKFSRYEEIQDDRIGHVLNRSPVIGEYQVRGGGDRL